MCADPSRSGQRSVNLGDDLFQLLVLLAVERDALFAGHHVHGLLVRVVLADVDVRLAFKLANLSERQSGVRKSCEDRQ